MPPLASRTEAPSCRAVMRRALQPGRETLIVYSVDLPSTNVNYPFGRETFDRREDAEWFIEKRCSQDPELGSVLRIEERALEPGEDNEDVAIRVPRIRAGASR